MREDDADLILAGNSLQALDGAIVGGVGLLVPAYHRPHLGERIDANQPPSWLRLAPFLDVLETALIEALPFGMQNCRSRHQNPHRQTTARWRCRAAYKKKPRSWRG